MSDPYRILGLPADADDAAVEAAYLECVKRSPPEADPRRFEVVREAYDKLKTKRLRLAYVLFDATPPTVEDVLERATPRRAPERPDAALFKALLTGQG